MSEQEQFLRQQLPRARSELELAEARSKLAAERAKVKELLKEFRQAQAARGQGVVIAYPNAARPA